MPQDEAVHDLARTLFAMSTDAGRMSGLYETLGEFCHLIRNRLNSMKLSLYLARRSSGGIAPDDWREVERDYQALEQFVEEFQTICRPIRLTTIPVDLGVFLREKAGRWRSRFEEVGRSLELDGPEGPVRGTFDPSQLGIALDALVSWRARDGRAGSAARLAWRQESDRLLLDWDESGVALETGSSSDSPRSALALPLIVRILDSHGGSLDVVPGERFQIRMGWPVGRGAAVPGGFADRRAVVPIPSFEGQPLRGRA